MNSIILTLFFMVLYSCAHNDPKISHTSGYDLHKQDGHCSLSRHGRFITKLKLKWPCQFHLDPQNELRIKKLDKYDVFLIEHSEKLATTTKDCRTQVQAVRIFDGKTEASQYVNNVAICLPFQWDEKVFIGLF